MADMATKQIIPAVVAYVGQLAESENAVRTAVPEADVSVQHSLITQCSMKLAQTREALEKLALETAKAEQEKQNEKKARRYRTKVVPAMAALRKPVDELEMLVDKDIWPMPSYGDLIF